MGSRPSDFDEELVKKSPTFIRWQKLVDGQSLRYACRDFIKGRGDDEERLMRRIMIARRNNLRDHAILKRARSHRECNTKNSRKTKCKKEIIPVPSKKRQGNTFVMTDEEVRNEMDVPAVEATRSFRAWLELEDGEDFTYNQKYIKGKPGHEWLLRKNIWRRMRYRRENKKIVQKMKGEESNNDEQEKQSNSTGDSNSDQCSYNSAAAVAAASAEIVDHALPSLLSGAEVSKDDLHDAVVEAAVAAAESYVQQARDSDSSKLDTATPILEEVVSTDTSGLTVHNPIMSPSSSSLSHTQITEVEGEHHHTQHHLSGFENAMDLAAKLAAAASTNNEFGDNAESDEDLTEV